MRFCTASGAILACINCSLLLPLIDLKYLFCFHYAHDLTTFYSAIQVYLQEKEIVLTKRSAGYKSRF